MCSPGTPVCASGGEHPCPLLFFLFCILCPPSFFFFPMHSWMAKTEEVGVTLIPALNALHLSSLPQLESLSQMSGPLFPPEEWLPTSNVAE